jgi:hypothetical protein
MEENNLVGSFEDSLGADIVEFAGDTVEFGADLCMDDGILKDFPFVGTAFKLYSIGSKIYDRHCLGKLYSFIIAINQGSCSKEDKERRRRKFAERKSFREQELQYLLVLIDRYVGFEKPQQLAKLYLAYLDGKIVWEELSMYAEIIDRFLMLDSKMLMSDAIEFTVHRNIGNESILRLVALGLMVEITDFSAFQKRENGNIGMTWGTLTKSISTDKKYKRTEFGDKLAEILR